MKYKAYQLKIELSQEITPLGWTSLISMALPELYDSNTYFSAYRINKMTLWGDSEIEIIQWYFEKIYNKKIPAFILKNSEYHKNHSYLYSLQIINNSYINFIQRITRL